MTGLPLDKAAEALGKSPRTILRWIHSGKIPATKVDGQWQVNVSDFRLISRTSHDDIMDTVSEMAAEIVDLKEDITLLKSQLEQKDVQIHELHVLLQQPKQLSEPGKKPWWAFWRRR